MEQNNTDYVANCPVSIGIGIGIIILGTFLNYVDALQREICRCFNRMLNHHLLAEFLVGFSSRTAKPSCADTCNCRKNGTMKIPQYNLETLSLKEVEMVMERLGICSINPPGGGVDNNKKLLFLGLQDIEFASVFEEQEPSLAEVKEAFDVFDTNRDGYIDAAELRRVLKALGVEDVSERECGRLIRDFDENNDVVIDLKEFTRLVEKSLS